MWHRDIRDGINLLHHDVVKSNATDLDPIFRNLALIVETAPDGRWLVDMGAFTSLSSTAIGYLYQVGRSTADNGGRVAMVEVQPFCEKVFIAAKLLNIIPFYKKREKALAYLSNA
jgi:anti-anti-sigma factor